MNQDIIALQKQYLTYLEQNPFTGNPPNLYDSMNYILSLGGKRVRPLLVLLGSQSGKGNIDDALPLAHMIEVFHNFSLVHDDIMDHADVRRGQPTVHKKWDEPTAILSGDNLLVKTIELWRKYNGQNALEILDCYLKTATEVCEGQQKDMDFAMVSMPVTENDYLKMIREKTAVLLGAALKVGFLSTNSNPEHADTFYDFAIQTGMSFQMMDDYLDSFGDGELTGKKQGGDILEGKNTWLKIKSHEMNDAKTLELFSLQGQERIDAVVSFWKEINLDKQIRERAQNYYNNSMADLDQIKKWGYDTTLLASLSEWLLGRTN